MPSRQKGVAHRKSPGMVGRQLHIVPRMREYAMRVLCVPATSAASERLFSKAGLTMTKKRMRLKSERLAQFVTVRAALTFGLLDHF